LIGIDEPQLRRVTAPRQAAWSRRSPASCARSSRQRGAKRGECVHASRPERVVWPHTRDGTLLSTISDRTRARAESAAAVGTGIRSIQQTGCALQHQRGHAAEMRHCRGRCRRTRSRTTPHR
jgi:hypothetical protein